MSEQWFKKRVRRLIRNPDELARNVRHVFTKYARFKGLYLKDMQKTLDRTIALIRGNFVADPPNFNMYFHVNDVNGVPTYITCRGTSQLENFHRIQERIFTAANTSPEVVHYTAVDFNVLWCVVSQSREA